MNEYKQNIKLLQMHDSKTNRTFSNESKHWQLCRSNNIHLYMINGF